jgi:glycogen debranching enzyme
MNETFYHTLTVGNLQDGSLYRVKKGSCLRLKCDPKLLSENVRVFCNYPHKDDTIINQDFQFKRAKFYFYDWKWPPNHLQNDDFDKFIEIELLNAGTFQYYFTINNDGSTGVESAKGGANIIVEPDLTFIDGTKVNLNCLQVQTVLTKLLGPLDEWDSRLITARNSGYNMFHFTPVEELSKISDSSYSIRDHRRLNSIASKNGQYTYNDLARQISRIYTDWNMFSICDLVYNHMSTCSPFLQDVPNAAYNLDNSPFLKPAYVLDRILFHLSKDIQNGAYVNIGISPDELRQHNLDQIRVVLTDSLLPKYSLEEFYQLNTRKTLDAIAERLQKKMETPRLYKTTQSTPTEILFSKLSIVQDKDYKRLGSTLDLDIVDAIIDAWLTHDNNDNNVLLRQFEKHLDYLNEQKRIVVTDWLNNAVNNCYLNAKYHFVANDGPKYKCIRAHDTPFVPRYFYSPLSSETSVEDDEQQMQTTDEAKFIMAHNGWVLDHDPLVNFCAPDSFVFIKRELIPWVDSIKLRYGLKPTDCPQLWQYMSEHLIIP